MASAALHLRDVSGTFRARSAKPSRDRADDVQRTPRLLCRVCFTPITSEDHRVAVEGQAVHRRTNPSGVTFTFGCYVEAPGARGTGAPTAEFSWFSGYVWSFALCRGCGEHLGWSFEGKPPAFFGLILERLVTGPAEGSAS